MTLDELVRALATQDEATFLAAHPEPALVFFAMADRPPVQPPELKRTGEETARYVRAATQLRTDVSPDLSRRRMLAETHGDAPTSSEGSITGESEVVFLAKTGRNPFETMITVGRTPNNDIWLPVGSVSKMHAYFVREAQGWRLIDQKSSNGTSVDGVTLPPGGSALIAGTEPKLGFGPAVLARFFTPPGLLRFLKERRSAPGSA